MDSKLDSGLLSIGAFSQASRLSQKALRLYGRQGLLTPAHTDPLTGYRYYAPVQLADARLILLLRQMDLPLARVRRVLLATTSEAAAMVQTYCEQRNAKATTEKRIAGEVLRCLHERHTGRTLMTTIQEKLAVTTFEAPPQLILTISKRVKVDALETHICDSCTRLLAFADAQPDLERIGTPFGIFHGPVNQEDDGPVEVCLPVRGAATPSGDLILREIEGGHFATATGTKDQSDFPRVLEIYDAVTDWMKDNGYAMSGPPREGWGECITVTWPYKK